jgi:DNA-binding HxlR family transcriptional regulator
MPKVCKLKEIKGKKYRCYFELALLIIGGKWKPVILFHLAQGGVMRFSELRRGMPGVTERMLARQLRELEKDGLVSRQVFREVPPRVEYRLTPQGCAVIPALIGLREWGVVYERHLGGPGRFEGGEYESPDPVAVNPECLAQAELVRQGVEIPALAKAKAGRGRKAEPTARDEDTLQAMVEGPALAEPAIEPTIEPADDSVAASIAEPIGEPLGKAAAAPVADPAVPGISEPVAAGDMEPEEAVASQAPVLEPQAQAVPDPGAVSSADAVPAPAQETVPAVVPEAPLAVRPESPAAVFLQPVPAVVPPAAPADEPEPEPAPKPERSGPSLLDFM